MTEPEFLDVEDVLTLHEQRIEPFGGSAGLRDRGLLEPAGRQRSTVIAIDLFFISTNFGLNRPFRPLQSAGAGPRDES